MCSADEAGSRSRVDAKVRVWYDANAEDVQLNRFLIMPCATRCDGCTMLKGCTSQGPLTLILRLQCQEIVVNEWTDRQGYLLGVRAMPKLRARPSTKHEGLYK